MYRKKYRKGQITIRQAFSAISRLIKDEWWVNQLKAQWMRWREALLMRSTKTVHLTQAKWRSAMFTRAALLISNTLNPANWKTKSLANVLTSSVRS
ncbi:TPA: hypothetical protein LSI04_004101 [Enterobacter cloacae]|nr:hypothetical protein [Enterobacter cloacae]